MNHKFRFPVPEVFSNTVPRPDTSTATGNQNNPANNLLTAKSSWATLLKMLLVLLMISVGTNSYAQNNWIGGSGTNWGTDANWSAGHRPTALEDAVIPNGVTATISINVAAVCRSLTFTSGGNSNTLSINAGSSLSVTNDITMNSPTSGGTAKILAVGSGTLSCSNITMSAPSNDNRDIEVTVSTGIINVTGNITMNGAAARNAVRFSGSGILHIGGNMTGGSLVPSTGTVDCYTASTQTMSGGYTYNNLTVNKSATANSVTFSTNAITVGGNLTVTTGNMILSATNANFSVTGGVTIASAGVLTNTVDYAATTRVLNVGGDWTNNGGTFTPGAGLVNFNSTTSNQNITGTAASQTFYNLTVNKSGTQLNVAGSTTTLNIGNALTLTAGTLAAGTASNINMTGGTWTNNGGAFSAGTGTVTFNSNTAAQNINGSAASQSFNNLVVNKTGQQLNVAGSTTTLSLTGTLTLTAGTFAAGTATAINIAGDWINNGGLFTPGSSTVTFNSTTAAQNISGTAASQTFYSITVNKAGQQLNVAGSTTTLNIGNAVTLSAGTFAAGTATAINMTSGNWTSNNGTFNPGSSTVTFSSTSGTQNINGSAVSQTFNNITVNKAGQQLTVGGSTATLNLNGTMLLTAGTFAIGTATSINIGGDWTNNGGTFGPTSGTVTFNSTTASQNINGTAASQTFFNLTVNNPGQQLNVAGSTTTLNIGGTATLTAGTFTAGTATSINVTGGNWTNNGGTFTPGSGTVTFNSTTAAQNINGSAASQTFNNIVVNKTGQQLNVAGSTTTLNLNGSMTLTAGTFSAGTATAINITGDWTRNGGSFTPGAGTVTFNSTAATQNINGSAASQTFYNIIINKTGQQLGIAGSTTTLTVSGSLTITAGTFAAGTATTINVAGTWTNNGAGFTAGSGTVVFNGGSSQTITGSTVTSFNNFTLNNSNGVSLSGTDININGGVSALTFTNGKITTGSNKVILASGAGISGAGAGKYVYGNLQMGVATGSPTRVFEIGDAAVYAPVSVVFNSVTVSGNVTAYTIGTEHANITSSTIDEQKSVNRYWNMANSGTVMTNYSPTFNFVAGDIDAGATYTSFIVGRRAGSWAYPSIGSRTATSITTTLSSFGDYACGEGGAGVPTMSSQPADQSGCSGASYSFTAAANSKPTSTVSWEISTDGGSTFSTLTIASPYSVSTNSASGVTTSTLTINPSAFSMNGNFYRAVFTNTRGNVTSSDGMITLLQSPTADAGAALSPICASGSSAPLGGSVGGSATGGTWSTPSGGTFSPNATTLNATWTPPGGFSGTATLTLTSSGGSCGTATSSKTQVVGSAPPALTINPASASICTNVVQALTVTTSTNSNTASGTVNVAIPDNSSAGASNTLAVSGIPANATINSISVTFNIAHNNDGDLIINLRAPNGNILNFVNRRGGSGNNFTNTIISSSGSTAISSGSSPFTGTYAADAANGVGATGQTSNVTAFSSLYSTPNGNWVLSARDANAGFAGTISNWTITINYTEPITWSPVTDLYTNSGATIAYTVGTVASTVYYKATAGGTTTYTATATNDYGCTSTQTVAVTSGPVVTITPDYCYGGGYIQLNASSTPAATSWLWNTGATTSSILVNLAGNYQVTATTGGGCSATVTSPIAQELVVNGDFSAGNSGFTSLYSYVTPGGNNMYPEATYTVNSNPNTDHGYFFGQDHTTGSGNMLIVNGSPSLSTVWEETFTVQPNTTYYFSAWAVSVNDAGPFAQLQFDINGSGIGTTAVLPAGPNNTSTPSVWQQFYGSWTSGPSETSATVIIKDLQTALGGNDFAIDDISFGTLSTFVNLSSGSGTDTQTVCKNNPITNITYTVGAGATGPSVTGLPPGVSYSFNGITLTISGTPTSSGTYNYTVTNSSCNPITKYGQIIVNEEAISFTSAAGTNAQIVCQYSAITNITYSITGGATGATVTGLPAGVNGSYSAGVFTISGTPTVAGVFNYTVTTAGICTHASLSGSITVRRQIITRTSAAGTNAQTICYPAAITNITYAIGGTATGASATGLPAGVTGTYNAGVFTISGTPTVVGVFNYTITTSGTCNPATATGTITITGPTVSLTSASGTDAQSICLTSAITNITYAIGGTATGASVTGLPSGVNFSYSLGVLTISGTPSSAGIFNYTVTTSGGSCGTVNTNGSITVNIQTISRTSAAGTDAQTLCINTAITNITYAVGGSATGAGVTGLPAGVSGTYNAGVFTISGTPSVTGTFNYTITTTGTCTAATANGSITVNGPTVTRTSAAGTDAQSICFGSAISTITYSVGGTATGANVSGLPTGVTGLYLFGTLTITGIPLATGTFNYTVTTSGGSCGTTIATGSIYVGNQSISLSSASGTDGQTVCINSAINSITYAVGGTGTGAGVIGLPAGVSGTYNAGVFTISGTPTIAGIYPYVITTTGTCLPAIAAGTITVSANPLGGTLANQSVCFGDNGTISVTGILGAVLGWETSTDFGTTWTPVSNTTTSLNFTNATQTTMYRVAVINGGCTSSVYSNTATIGIHNLWVGLTSTDWNTASNWSDGLLPNLTCADVTVPVISLPFVYPQLTSGSATINNLIIHPGASMTISNATMHIAGSITNNGILNVENGTIELNGTSSAQSIAGSMFENNTIKNLILSNSNGINFTGTNDTVKITGLLSFGASNTTLNTNNNLTLVSNATGTASLGDLTNGGALTGVTIVGNATVERYIPLHPKAWQFLAAPTSGQSINNSWQEGNATLSNLIPGRGTTIASNIAGALALGFDFYTPAGGPSMKIYNPVTDSWDGVASTSIPITNKKGYMFFVRGDRSVTTSTAPATATTLRTTGKLFTTGLDAPLPTTVLPGKLESIGNPYASAIDFTKITKPAAPAVDDMFYVWDPLLTNGYYGLGGYQTISAVNGWKPIPGGTANYDANVSYPYIQSGQAFFVHATGAGGTVTFSESCKITGDDMVNRPATARNAEREFFRASLYNVSGFLSDGNVVAIDPTFGNGIDADDAMKMTNTSENFGIKRNNQNLSIEARGRINGQDTIFYSIANMKKQAYQFRFGPENMQTDGLSAILVDKYLNSSSAINLMDTTVYNFSVTTDLASSASDRFYVVFNRVEPPAIIQVAANRTSRNHVKVNWTTAREAGIVSYTIERGTNGTLFSEMASAPVTGNNNTTVSYEFNDNNAPLTAIYYRVSALKNNGTVIYSAVVRVPPQKTAAREEPSAISAVTSEKLISVYPNPVENKVLHIQFSNQQPGNYRIELIGKMGQVIYKTATQLNDKYAAKEIQLPSSVASGTYQLKITYEDGTVTTLHLIIR